MSSVPLALTPAQVNSWPTSTPDTYMSGEPLRGTASNTPKAERHEKLLLLAKERFKLCVESSAKQRQEMLEDLKFAYGIQWDIDIENKRRAQDRPCLTINRVDGFLAHAVNNMRQARPAIKIDPVADGADEDIASLKEGLIRHIQTNSGADIPYDESFRGMCTMGLSWMRVVDDWAAPDSFDQELFIRWVPNSFCVYADPFCQQPDWSDMKFAFVVLDLTKAEFKAKFGDSWEVSGLENFTSLGDQSAYWFPGGKIRVAEYFFIDQQEDILCEMETGKTQRLSKLPKGMYQVRKVAGTDELGLYTRTDETDDWADYDQYVGRARKCKIPIVNWTIISGLDVLRERIWKGKYIPLIPVLGNQIELDGERILVGMVRYAREPQRMYNYMYTSFVETVALAPRSPFVAEVDQMPDGLRDEMWGKANTNPQAVLLYKRVVTENGDLVPPPQRQQAEPPIAAFVQGLQMADQNLKSVFRIFDASLGQRGPQESGLAINARKIESDTGIYNWGDNFIRALRYLGTILEDLLQYYYNTPGRVFQITQDDDTTKEIVINQNFEMDGQVKKFDLSKGGKYATVVSTGPSYQTKRAEAAQSMIDFFKMYPAGLQACAHLLVGELDFPGKEKIKAQLEKILPPNLQDKPDDQQPLPPQVQAQVGQLMQQVQLLSKALNEATDKVALEDRKEMWATLRTQMTQEVALASAELKAKVVESTFLSQKIFDELEHIRAVMEPQLESSPAKAAQPGQAPSSAVPQTSGGNPPVGGV